MRRKWLKWILSLALPSMLFLPLNYLIRSRRPVSVDIGQIKGYKTSSAQQKEAQKVVVRTLSDLLRKHSRAVQVEVRFTWQRPVAGSPVRLGSLSYERISDVVRSNLPFHFYRLELTRRGYMAGPSKGELYTKLE